MKGFYILMGVALIRVFAKTEVGEKEARSCLAKRSEKYYQGDEYYMGYITHKAIAPVVFSGSFNKE